MKRISKYNKLGYLKDYFLLRDKQNKDNYFN